MSKCPDCKELIRDEDDDAGVCIQCGGLNRRLREVPEGYWDKVVARLRRAKKLPDDANIDIEPLI